MGCGTGSFEQVKKKSLVLLLLVFLLCFTGSVSVEASAYVKRGNTKVSLTSSKHGWVKKGKYYYFYNSRGRLLRGQIRYKGKNYYSSKSGRRVTGWVIRGGKRYYYNRKNGVMFTNRWATGTKYKYYFNKSGVAIASRWFTDKGPIIFWQIPGWLQDGKRLESIIIISIRKQE